MAAVAAATIAAGGCAVRRHADAKLESYGAGFYRARLSEDAGRPLRFRLLLYAELPDRMHAEVLSPLGSTEVQLDGGGGRLAVTLVGEGHSYVGQASPEALEKILGVRLSLEELVRALLVGALPQQDCRLEREPGPTGALPSRLTLCCAGSCLQLALKRRLTPARSASLGTGAPPPGTTIRPLAELEPLSSERAQKR